MPDRHSTDQPARTLPWVSVTGEKPRFKKAEKEQQYDAMQKT